MTDSIAFDRAAEYYDRTRALPHGVQAEVAAFLAGELGGRARVLEVGVGTGRMALPAAAAGLDVVGVDLSEPMLRRLAENAGGSSVVPAARADGLALPFPGGAFGAVFLCHVLHLIPAWRDAVGELVRVARPGGLVLVDIGGVTTKGGREVGRFFEQVAGVGRLRPGLTDAADLEAALAELGCVRREPVVFPYALEYSIAEILERLESNEWSSTWSLSEDARLRAVAETRAWAEGRYPDLAAPLSEVANVVWRGFETPA